MIPKIEVTDKMAAKSEADVLIVSPVRPPQGGITSWTQLILKTLQHRPDCSAIVQDSSVQWRRTGDLKLYKRVIGGSIQGVYDTVRMARLIRKARPSILHLCTSASLAGIKDLLMVSVAHAMGVGTVVHYHTGELPDHMRTRKFEWKLSRAVIKRSDFVILLDEPSVVAVQREIPDAQIELIPNPVDPELIKFGDSKASEANGQGTRVRIVFVGRVEEVKGMRELVRACSQLNGLDFELQLVGPYEQDFKEELIHLAGGKDSDRWLKFFGEIDRKSAWTHIRDADLFAFPTHTEGFPYALLEAMVLGKPIVASRVGAVPAMLADGTDCPCAIFIEPGDIPALVRAISALVRDRRKGQELGQRARSRAIAQYGVDSLIDRYIELWRKARRAS
jgi:glycosyltransferase involved in cell wall biosynthesis